MTSRELPDALLRRRKTNEHVRIQDRSAAPTSPGPLRLRLARALGLIRVQRDIAALDVPPRRDVDRHDRQAGARDERERSVERGAHGGPKREAKDGIEDDVARGERRRERRLGQLGVRRRRARLGRGRQRPDVHVCALRVQALVVVGDRGAARGRWSSRSALFAFARGLIVL